MDINQAAETKFQLRPYQQKIIQRALKENVVFVGPTGVGKSLVAIKLILSMDYTTQKIAFVLGPTQQLVFQLFRRIEKFNQVNAGSFCGRELDLWDKSIWEEQFVKYNVFVATADTLLNLLNKGYLSMSKINLIVFDECHHARKRHPYKRIMTHYNPAKGKVMPRIFGTTSCPTINTATNLFSVVEKVDAQEANCANITAHKTPVVKIPYLECEDCIDTIFTGKLLIERYKQLLRSFIIKKKRYYKPDEIEIWLYRKKMDVTVILHDLGPWCFLEYAQLHLTFLKNTRIVFQGLLEDENLFDAKASRFIQDCQEHKDQMHVLSSISQKLITVFTSVQDTLKDKNHKKVMIFVTRRDHCRLIYNFLKLMINGDECFLGCVIGQSRSNDFASCDLPNLEKTMADFEKCDIGIIVTTSVSCEGIDIPMCGMVIIFNELTDPRMFIQVRGRARHESGKILYFIPINDDAAPVRFEKMMLHADSIKNLDFRQDKEIKYRDKLLSNQIDGYEFIVPSSGARINLDNSISSLFFFCQLIPGYEKYELSPVFEVKETHHIDFKNPDEVITLYQVTLTLPSCLDVAPIVSPQMRRKILARAVAAYVACEALLNKDLLDENFNPVFKDLSLVESVYNLETTKLPEIISTPTSCSIDCASHEVLGTKPIFENSLQEEQSINLYLYQTNLCTKLLMATSSPWDIIDFKCQPTLASIAYETNVQVSKEEWITIKQYYKKFITLVSEEDFSDASSCWSNDCSTFDTTNVLDKGYLFVLIKKKENGKIVIDFEAMISFLQQPLIIPFDDKMCINDIQGQLIRPDDHCKRLFRLVNVSDKTIAQVLEEREAIQYQETSKKIIPLGGWYRKLEIYVIANISCTLLKSCEVPLMSDLFKCLITRGKAKCNLKKKRLLIGSLCSIVSISYQLYSQFLMWMFLAFQLEDFLKVKQLKKMLHMEHISHQIMKEATHRPDYQRLESLGDSYLKFEITWYLYKEKPSLNLEGVLTLLRTDVVQNDRLFTCMIQKSLHFYIQTPKDYLRSPLEYWRPSGCMPSSISHELHPKAIADVFESICGALIVGGDELSGRSFLQFMSIPVLQSSIHLKLPFANQSIQSITVHPISLDVVPGLDLKSPFNRHDELMSLLQYSFHSHELLIEAITHPSSHRQGMKQTQGDDYQRLEFLGDAVIEYIVMVYGFHSFTHWTPGDLTKWKKKTLSNNALGLLGIFSFHIHEFIIHSIPDYTLIVDEMKELQKQVQHALDTNQLHKIKTPLPKLFADVVEALIGAIFVDSQYDLHLVTNIILPKLLTLVEQYPDPD